MTVTNKYCIYNYMQGRYWTDGKGDVQTFSLAEIRELESKEKPLVFELASDTSGLSREIATFRGGTNPND